MDIHNTLLTSLRKLAKQHTEETLGDRRNYLGASDIGYCPRKTILERIHPGEHDLATLLRFQRGHMTEDIVAMAFSAAGFNNYERQVEISVEGDVPLKAHIDFADGNVGFFNGYKPEETIFNGLLERAGTIWSEYQDMQNGEEVYPDTETDPLCGFCNHITTCPRFEGEDVPQLAKVVEALQDQQAKEKIVKGEIKLLKRNLQEMFRGSIHHTAVHPREIVKEALLLNASAVILAHNYPSGNSQPSKEDIFLTNTLKDILDVVEVKILDHMVVGDDVTAFTDVGLLKS